VNAPDRATTVYSWVAEDWSPDSPPRTLPAVRLWGDVILERLAARREFQPDPPVGIRRTAIFAWTERVAPQVLAGTTVGRRRVELKVSPELCAAARVDLVHELFDPVSWRALREWLVDRGQDRDFIEEDVVVFTDPMAAMLVEGASEAVGSTSPDLLEKIITYFERIGQRYLDSWTRLTDADGHDMLEVVVPSDAIIDVVE
jgi:hypothetical protein